MNLVVFLLGAIQEFKSGLNTLRGGDLDEFLDLPVVGENSLGRLFLGPVRHVDGLPSISSLLALYQTICVILRLNGQPRDPFKPLFLGYVGDKNGAISAMIIR